MRKFSISFTFFLAASLILSACQPRPTLATPVSSTILPTAALLQASTTPQINAQPGATTGTVFISGDYTYTNGFVVETYFVEHAAALVDMHGFVIRDQEWEIPVDSQVLGFTKIDSKTKKGTYQVQLPALPMGVMNHVNPNNKQDLGVQIFTTTYWPNLYGGPYSEGDDRSRGWPTYLTSVKIDTQNHDEVSGGKLVVWAPDANQQFPTGYGADGLLFTGDDPVGPLPAGYSVIDLDQKPFAILRDQTAKITLYEPSDVSLKDYSKDSYSAAFQKLMDFARQYYAFNGIQGKQPDWDKLYAELAPRVKDAETKKDPTAWYEALRDFTYAFKDGHVNLDGGQPAQAAFSQLTSGGYGFAIRETDDAKAIVVYVLKGSPADNAGIKVGAEITQYNNDPIALAIGKVKPLSGPFSTATAERYQQARYLLRAAVGAQASVTFSNLQETSKTVALTAIQERQSFNFTSIYSGLNSAALPVEFRILESGVGYIKINSNNDDLNLIIRLFERALKTFTDNQVTGLIIDMRLNPGGAPLGLAGFLTNQEIPLGQLEYFSPKTGKFEADGPREKVSPNGNQYHFNKMALLVSQACASACEIEAYGFSQVPGMAVVGQYPSGGIEAEVARGQFSLPEGMSFQMPTGRFSLPDGSIFLEGKGVQPTVHVPVNAENLLSGKDAVLDAAVTAVSLPLGAGITPSGPPQLTSIPDAKAALQKGATLLEARARETYDNLSQAGQTYIYTIPLDKSETLAWVNGWCSPDQATLDQNIKFIHIKFTMDGVDVPLDRLAVYDGPSGGSICHFYYTVLDQWPAGEHHLQNDVTFDQPLKEGAVIFPAGSHTYVYNVYVKP